MFKSTITFILLYNILELFFIRINLKIIIRNPQLVFVFMPLIFYHLQLILDLFS
jgi:hypothetical protein